MLMSACSESDLSSALLNTLRSGMLPELWGRGACCVLSVGSLGRTQQDLWQRTPSDQMCGNQSTRWIALLSFDGDLNGVVIGCGCALKSLCSRAAHLLSSVFVHDDCSSSTKLWHLYRHLIEIKSVLSLLNKGFLLFLSFHKNWRWVMRDRYPIRTKIRAAFYQTV